MGRSKCKRSRGVWVGRVLPDIWFLVVVVYHNVHFISSRLHTSLVSCHAGVCFERGAHTRFSLLSSNTKYKRQT
jgi:hypothetical protein